MIAKTTIEKVQDLPIEDVIGKFVELRKSGANWCGKSPFVNEKTGSFMVSVSKNIWKCFSGGKGGGGSISFVMEKEHLSFPEAIKHIAELFNIEVDYDDSEAAQVHIQKTERKTRFSNVNNLALQKFLENAESVDLEILRADKETAELFQIGFSNKDFKDIYHAGLEKGLTEKEMIETGVITKKGGKIYDFWNKRVMFPIFDHRKILVGFGGRDYEWKKGDKSGKYINSKQSDLFDKSKSLYGIHLAKDEMLKTRIAHIVEGFYDVHAMFNASLSNTVSPCGTAFTEEQAKILKRYCDTIRLVFDGDKAGFKAAQKSILMLAPLDFNIEVVFMPTETDPDSFEGNLLIYIETMAKDAVEYMAEFYFQDAETTIRRAEAESKLERLLADIPNARLRNAYSGKLCKKYKISKAQVEKNIKIVLSDRRLEVEKEGKVVLPAGVDQEEFDAFGFYETKEHGNSNTGYWFPNPSFKFEQQSNFIIRPLFHIYSKTDNKRLVEITNFKVSRIIDVPSRGFVGITQFLEAVINEGNFWFHGQKHHFQKIMVKILEKFPTCEEIKTLGWQNEGFWAFANGIVDGGFKKVDKYGIVKFGSGLNDPQYFLPAFSDVYSQVREEDDLYENDRFFIYRKSDNTFKEWSKQFIRVHGDNGKIGIAFLIAALSRDFIYSIYKVFPHLFLFGDVSTGKSYCAWSINSIFHGAQPGFNLTSGTQVGFFRKLAKYKNAISWFDEYENDIDQKRFQALKAAYDGLGHERGVMSHDNRTETTKINSASVISGQYLPTRDGNSLFTRSIVLSFGRKADELTGDDIKQGEILKQWEKAGLTDIILEILKYRGLVLDKFSETAEGVSAELKKDLEGSDYHGRIMLNYMLILTPIKILSEKLELPFKYKDLYSQVIGLIKKQSEQISDSDALRTFWKIIEFLNADDRLEDGVDFKIETKSSLYITVSRTEKKTINFKDDKKCLFVRFTRMHPLYMEAHKRQHSENGINDTSLKHYMKNDKAFLGLISATPFDTGNSSAYVFDLDMLDVNLTGLKKQSKPKEAEEVEEKDLPF